MSLSDKIKKIYIIHYEKLTDRKKYLDEYFEKNNIKNIEYRSLYPREKLTEEIKNNFYKLKPNIYYNNTNEINPVHICITIEHVETYKEIVNQDGNDDEWYLILEDDAIFYDNFIEKINYYLDNIPSDAEYLDINDYMGFDIYLDGKYKNETSLWQSTNDTRTTGSYLVNKKLCKKLLKTMVPFTTTIDFELNLQIRYHDIKIYWSRTPLIQHGSFHSYNGSSYKY